jgi:hypothetical protein
MADGDPLDYQAMVQRALRGVLREALEVAAEEGLSEDHQFYVSFRTRDPGVIVPPFLRDRFPEEVTIVLQHQFWDLHVDDAGFSVTLAFEASRQRVGVPWEAVTAFIDPPAEFALRFGPAEEGAEPSAEGEEEGEAAAPGSAVGSSDPGAEVVNIRRFRKKDED